MTWREAHRERVMELEAEATSVMMRALGAILDRVAGRLGAVTVAAAGGEARASAAELDAILSDWRQAVDREVLPYFGGIFQAGAVAAGEQMAGIGVVVPAPDPEFIDQASVRHLASVRDQFFAVGDDAWEAARGELLSGFREGEGIDQLRSRVRGATGMAQRRAEAVARTHVIGASNLGAAARVEQMGDAAPPFKQWLSTMDGRTRPSHVRADAQVVPRRQAFTVGSASLQVPGDPSGPYDEVVNCRCTVLFLDSDEAIDIDARQEGGTAESAADLATPGIVDLVADPGLAPEPPSLRSVALELGDGNRSVASALSSGDRVPVTRYGLSHGDGDADRAIFERAGRVDTGDMGQAVRARVKLEGTLTGQSTVNPHHIAKLITDRDGVLEDGGYTADHLPHVVEVDGRHVLYDGHHRAIGDAAVDEDGTFEAWVWREARDGPAPGESVTDYRLRRNRERREARRAAVERPEVPDEDVGPRTDVPVREAFTDVAPEWQDTFDRAMAAIDFVHSDGQLPPATVSVLRRGRANGHYRGGRAEDGPDEIALSPEGSSPPFTLIHEVGHQLDHEGMPADPGMPFSWLHVAPNVGTAAQRSAMADVMAAMRGSAAGRRLLDLDETGLDAARYLSSDIEMWARAYSQWVALLNRERDPEIWEQCARRIVDYRNDPRALPLQWDEADFAPIAEAIERLMVSLNWRTA
jgi:hypothetical protein